MEKKKPIIIKGEKYIKPYLNIKTLTDLEKGINSLFPNLFFELKAGLSVLANLSLMYPNGCTALNYVDMPSTEKTTVLSLLSGLQYTYETDNFTPKSFVTHAVNIPQDDLKKIDLLPRIRDKCMLIPELAPIFGRRKEELLENISTLTRVLDGQGLQTDSGVHGQRGYSGDYYFCWLGATTPLKWSVWEVMGHLGNRMLFLDMKRKPKTKDDYIRDFIGEEYQNKIIEGKKLVHGFLTNFFEKYPIRKVEWNNKQDTEILSRIVDYAKLVSRLRGSLQIWKTGSGSEAKYEHAYPIIEGLHRLINSFFNLAKGHALINNRTFLREEDLEIVKRVALSSMPYDRYKFFNLLVKYGGRLAGETIEHELGCSNSSAHRTMNAFGTLGIVDIKDLPLEDQKTGRPLKFIELKKEFSWILSYTQSTKYEKKSFSQENVSVSNLVVEHAYVQTAFSWF